MADKDEEYGQLNEKLNILVQGDSLDTLTTTFEEAQNTKLYGVPLKIDHTTLGKVEDKIKQFEHDIEKKKKELEDSLQDEMEKGINLKLRNLKQAYKSATTTNLHGKKIIIDDTVHQAAIGKIEKIKKEIKKKKEDLEASLEDELKKGNDIKLLSFAKIYEKMFKYSNIKPIFK